MCMTTFPAAVLVGTGGGELRGGDVLGMTCAPGTGGIATSREAGLPEAADDAELLMESCW